jgi:hypothetical protein
MALSQWHHEDGTATTSESARPTPPPPFDIVRFARESESSIRAVALLESVAVPAAPPALGLKLKEVARRAELLDHSLRAGALSRDEAVRALCNQLVAVADSARHANVEPLADAVDAFERVITELENVSPRGGRVLRNLIVADPGAHARVRVALAAEVLGFEVRSASTLDELSDLADELAPDAVLAGEAMCRLLPGGNTCASLSHLSGGAPVVLFADSVSNALADTARRNGAAHSVSTRGGIDHLLTELGTMLELVLE